MPTAPILITLPVPPSANAIWRPARRGRVVKSAQYSRWLEECDLIGLTTRVPRDAIQTPVSISITVRSGTGWRRDRDIDNIVKPTLDWLVRWCVIADDNCGIVRHIEVSYDMLPISAACVQIVISRHGV